MQSTTKHKPEAAILANVSALLSAGQQLIQRPPHLDGLGVMYGPSGYGKSVAATVLAVTTHAAYVEARSSWTRKAFLEAVAVELGVAKEKTVTRMADAIGERLAATQRLLIVDEADILVDKGIAEIIRELHMISHAPIMMIGEEALPAKLKRWERIDNRVSAWVPAQPCDLDDARALARMYVGDRIAVADDLLTMLVTRCRGRVRRIVTNLDRARIEATRAGVDAVDLRWWGGREVWTGEAPARDRKVLA